MPGALAFLLASAAASAGDLVPTDPRFGPLRVARHKVDVAVDNQIAITRVEQVFANDHGVQLEGQYTFPVPKGASIIDFSMTIDGKLMRGEVLEKDRARRIYEGIVRQAKDPGLLEHAGANLFRVRVFPLLPRAEQKIELTYVERVPYDAGVCRYVHPLLVPGAPRTTKADRFEFSLRLASRIPIREVSCPTHAAEIVRRGEESAVVSFAGSNVDLSTDLEVSYRIARGQSGMDLVPHRPDGQDGTFLLLLTPHAEAPRLPKDMTFVFDTSGSMEGKRIAQAKAALKFCLSKLGPDDRFNILTFSSDVTPYRPAHVPATAAEKERAAGFIDRIDATGSTNISEALERALLHAAEAGRPHLVLFLTDGRPTAGERRPEEIVRKAHAANRGGARLFTFGVGNDLDRSLLDDLAEGSGAVSEHVAETEDIEVKVSRLQQKIASPVITGLTIDWGGAEVSALFPKVLGDLYAGAQLMVTGRYRKAGTFEVVLRGRAGAKPVELRQQVVFPERIDVAPGVPYLWAMRRVATLMDDIRRSGENPELVNEVISVGKAHRIATPYTSFLVLETEQAFDRHGVDRRSGRWQPPTPSAQAPARPAGTGKVFVPPAPDLVLDKSLEDADFQKSKGDSENHAFPGRGTFDVVGGGAGGGGRYGSRFGGKAVLAARGGGGGDTEDAVLAALKWLARNQKADGSWDAGTGETTVASTGLSLLAFLGAGYSHLSKNTYDGVCFGDVVRKALQYLFGRQDADGCLAERSAPHYLRSHAVAALALSEAYGITGSNLLRDPAQKSVDFLVSAQNPGQAWGGTARSGANDLEATGWSVAVFRSAELGGLAFPVAPLAGARAWFDLVTDASGRLRDPSDGIRMVPGTATAVSAISRLYLTKDKGDARLAAAAALLVKELPTWNETNNDPAYRFWGTQALFQYDGGSGPHWRAWNAAMKTTLLEHQDRGDQRGSWAPSAPQGSRASLTALNALTLEVYYRHPAIFGRK
jgi:Ca-activated chloride channel family protein